MRELQEELLLWLMRLARRLGAEILDQRPDRGAQKILFIIPYRDKGHRVAAVISTRRWPVSEKIASRYLRRLEAWAVKHDTAYDVDVETYVALFPRVTKPRWNISGTKAYLIMDYKHKDTLHQVLLNLYSKRCKYAKDGLRDYFCSIHNVLGALVN